MSDWFVLASAGFVVSASAYLGMAVWCLNRELGVVAARLNRAAQTRNDLNVLTEQRAMLRTWQTNSEESVDGTVQGIQVIHILIARVVLSLFEGLGAPRDKARAAMNAQNSTSNQVYAAIRSVNKLVGERFRRKLR